MELTHQQIFERYLYAGAITRDPDAIAAMFTEDGVLEAPLVAAGHPLRHLAGRDAIRAGTAAYHTRPAPPGTIDIERTAYVLHDTADPAVFIAEIDVVLAQADGTRTTMSLVQIFRLRNGRIAVLRDYFSEPEPEPEPAAG
ncbi:nuclear transport factor 2 family protein [Actinoplanes sp. NPDC026670]|uniref:nuclear transport factor 2 family protein n=1 Tax=Actinoplanes sp. NPDC026670 TaxID=3154700 RepID=UPI0033EB1663